DLRNILGCQILVDDKIYFKEPVFQDGDIAQAVNTVVASGALYFSAAGNYGNLNDRTSSVWEGEFVPTTPPPAPALRGSTVHNFGGVNFNTIGPDINGNPPDFITLQWADPWGRSTNDYNLYILDSSRTVVVRQSTNSQTGTQDPYEEINVSLVNTI